MIEVAGGAAGADQSGSGVEINAEVRKFSDFEDRGAGSTKWSGF
jgi:hypothetical protein